MKKLALIAAAAVALPAAPALAIDAGVAAGSGQAGSQSSAGSASSGGSASAIFGATTQQSSGAANSNGSGSVVFTNNNMLTTSDHTSQTTQQGSTGSAFIAGSSNQNATIANGSSASVGNIATLYGFVGP